MSVITISGRVGAGEDIIGEQVAEALGYRLIGRTMILEVLKQYGIVDHEKILDTPPYLFDGLVDEKRSANDLLNSLYLLLAKRNNVVLVSRRAFLSLEPFLNVFSVFLQGPEVVRRRNIMEWKSVNEKKAAQTIRKEEESRRGIIESFHNRKWDSMQPWTLVVDTNKLGLEYVVKMIVGANTEVAKADELFGWQDGIPTTDTIETDPAMESAVDRVFSEFVESGKK